MILKVIRTTDHQYLGLTMEIPNPLALKDQHVQVGPDIYFRIDKVEDFGQRWRFSNPGYIAIAEVVE